jgi:hypothetical protein
MKKISRILVLLSMTLLFAVANSSAQEIVVHVRPPRPRGVVVVRPPRPSRHHVWVAEEWSPNGGAYVYHGGYWVVPPHPGAIWIAGHWRHRRDGYIWISGHWSI